MHAWYACMICKVVQNCFLQPYDARDVEVIWKIGRLARAPPVPRGHLQAQLGATRCWRLPAGARPGRRARGRPRRATGAGP